MSEDRSAVKTKDIPGVRQPEATALAESQNAALLRLLRALDDDQWNAPTDCEGWSVHDIVAHLCGWAELTTSFGEMRGQLRAMRARRKEFDNFLDALNQVQVDSRKALPPQELTDRYEAALRKMMKLRTRYGRYGRYVPIGGPPEGFSNLGFLMNVIFTRDSFMHRIDISRATGAEMELGPNEARLVADIVRNWSKKTTGSVRLVLTGPAGGTYLTGDDPRAEITADAVEFCRFYAGRADKSVFEITGEASTADRRLDVAVSF